MKRSPAALSRLCAALVLALGLALLVSAFCWTRFAVRDVEFVLRSPVMDPWAQTWIWRGDSARYGDLDSGRAALAYWGAVGRNPLLLGAWFALARLEPDAHRAEGLRRFLLAHLPRSAAWAWQRCLLAADGGDEAGFAQAFNAVLHRLPGHRREAVEVGLGFWGGWREMLARTDCANRWALFGECMERRAVEDCIELYPHLEQGCGALLDAGRRLAFTDFLLRNRRWAQAVEAGRDAGLFRDGLVTNGRFEEPWSGKGFDWRLDRVAGVEARREPRGGTGAGQAVRFRFSGTANPRYEHFRQYAPLRPKASCELAFSWKAHGLTSDQGLYVEVRGEGCEGLSVRSPVMTGSRDWSRERLGFVVPDGCLVARIALRRDRSLKFDANISGELWLAAVELIEKSGPR